MIITWMHQLKDKRILSLIFILFKNLKLMIMSHNFPPKTHEKLCHSYCLLRRRGWSSAAGALAWAWLWPERMASRWTPCLLVSGPWVYLRTQSRRRRKRKKNQFFTLIIWLTVVIHLLWPSSLSKSVAFSWLTGRSEIACSERSLVLFEGEKGLPENDCWDRGCPDAPNHALHTCARAHTHTHTGFVHM